MSTGQAQASNMHEAAEDMARFVTDLGRSLTCTICVRPLYEPYTSACGHTHCYSCLCLWFASCGREKTCADCRAPIETAPAPAYLIRELTHKLTSKAELLPEGETVQQHLDQRAEEAAKVDADKTNTDGQSGGLFKGMFRMSARLNPMRDMEDGVDRCPLCHWELEDDSCLRCGYTDLDYEDDALMEEILQDHEDDMTPSESGSEPQLTFLSDMVARNRQHEDDDSDEDESDSSMDSFLDDGDSELADRSSYDSSDEEQEVDDTEEETRQSIQVDGVNENSFRSGTSTSDEESEETYSAAGSTRSDDAEEGGKSNGSRRRNFISDEESGDETDPNPGSSSSSNSTAMASTVRPTRSACRRRVVSSDMEDETSESGADGAQSLTSAPNVPAGDDSDDSSEEDKGPVRLLRQRAQPGRATRNSR